MTILPVLFDNPIFTRELRRRMRGKAMVFSLVAYVGLVCAASYLPLAFRSQSLDPTKGLNYLSAVAEIGRTAFYGVLALQAVLALIVAPAITAGMIAAERERQTFDFLRVTTIRPYTFVFGGLLSTLLYVLLALVCALPVLCVPFLYGGMSPGELAGWSGTLMGASLVLCSLGLCLSSVRDRTREAQTATIVVTVLLFLGVMSALSLMRQRAGGGGLTAPLWRRYALSGGALDAPGWALFAAVAVFASAALLLVACRKLYEPEARALSYWQFFVLFAAVMGCLMGIWRGDIRSERLCVWFWLGGGLLCSAAMAFCPGRTNVGDDLWRLKRIVAPLRRIDESIPVLAALAAAWSAASVRFGLSGGLAIDRSALVASAMFMAAPALCLGVVERLISLTAARRTWAARAAPAVAVVLWVVLPALIQAGVYSPRTPGASLKAAAWLSPFYAIPLLAETPARGAVRLTLADWFALPGSAMATTCFVIAIAGLPLVFHKYWKWSKDVKYTS